MNLRKTTAITLLELLMATTLISIIMLAVGSFDIAVWQFTKSSDRNSVVSMRNAMAMLRIVKDAQFAVGDVANAAVDTTTTPGHLCFRQDLTSTPDNYADDQWVCYRRNGTNLRRCVRSMPPAAAPPLNCAGGTATTVGTLTDLQYPNPTPTENIASEDLYLEVTIVSRFDPTQGVNNFTNPEHRLTTRINFASPIRNP